MSQAKTKAETLARDIRIWDYYTTQQYTQMEIARLEGCHQSTVSKSLKRSYERLVGEINARILAFKLKQDAELREVINQAWAAWEKSKEPSTRVAQDKVGVPPAEDGQVEAAVEVEARVVKTTTTRETRSGQSAYLNTILSALGQQSKLWGLDSPEKHEINLPSATDARGEGGLVLIDQDDMAESWRVLHDTGHPVILALMDGLDEPSDNGQE